LWRAAGSDPKRQEKFTVAWLTNKTTDPFESMSMNLLSRLLLNGPNAPMYKALIDTNIGTTTSHGRVHPTAKAYRSPPLVFLSSGLDYAPSTGYDSGARSVRCFSPHQEFPPSHARHFHSLQGGTIRHWTERHERK
jgi:hypothetical protein